MRGGAVVVMVETANGYVLCAAHASAWRRRGNDVATRPASAVLAAMGCADCLDAVALPDGPLTVVNVHTGQILQGWRDPEGLWLDDPDGAGSGYAWDDGDWRPAPTAGEAWAYAELAALANGGAL